MADDAVDGSARADAGDSGDAEAQADAGPMDYTSRCEDETEPRAVVAIINGAEDDIAVYRLEHGRLEGPTLRQTGFDNPRRIAMRSDGREAAIAYGGFGNPYGVVIVAFNRDGSEPRVVDEVEVGVGQTPFGIAYAGNDHLVVATAGPEIGILVALGRSGDTFAPGTVMGIPGNWPLEVVARPDSEEVILSRAKLSSDEAADVYLVVRSGETWQIAGDAAAITPPALDIAIHPRGDTIYGPTSDPDDRVSVDNLEAPGLLHVLGVGPGGMSAVDTAVQPGLSSRIAIHPDGHFLLLTTSNYEYDTASGTPIARSFGFTTVPLDQDGMPSTPLGPGNPHPVLLFNSLEVAASGHAVTAREQYASAFPEQERHPVTVWAQPSPGVWQECHTVQFDGQVQLSIAP